MNPIWCEDLIALAQTHNFRRAAQLRHVTHPAFSRRIQALESWAQVPLVDRSQQPVKLTLAGDLVLQYARQIQAQTLGLKALLASDGRPSVTLATGRTLARTLAVSWIKRIKPGLGDVPLKVRTRALSETVKMLESDEADFMLTYFHASLGLKLDSRVYRYLAMAEDELVPVVQGDVNGKPLFDLVATPYLAYAEHLALGQLVKDRLTSLSHKSMQLTPLLDCDSADAMLEYCLAGLGTAWLPWSMVAGYVKKKQLSVLGGKAEVIRLETRMYRKRRRAAESVEKIWALTEKAPLGYSKAPNS